MDDGYTDCEVEVFGLMRKGENVGDADGMGLVLARDGDEVCRSIGAYYENFRIHSQILAVAAADIEAYRAGWKRLEKAFYDGPRLVAGGREVGGNLLINGMHMLFLVAFAMLILLRWVLG